MKELSEQQIQTVKSKVSSLVERANSFIVETIEDVSSASEFLKTIKGMENKVEEKRLEFIQPLNQSLKAINDTFRKLRMPLEQVRKSLSNKILSWRKEEEEKIRKEEERRRKIQEAHKKAGHEIKEVVELEKVKATIGSTRTKKVWTFEIVDFSKVPDSYKELNSVAVNQAIRTGVREINGLKIFQKEQLSII